MNKTIMKLRIFLLLAVILAGFEMCRNPNSDVIKQGNKISDYVYIEDRNFKDPFGRDLILSGINVVNKNPETNYVGHITPEEMAKFKSWGFNVIRLGMIWDGLEPEPGIFNEDYLVKIDEMIQWAAEYDLYVFLDMHQDLYSVEFSDGAPSWATITDNHPHHTGDIWSDAYLISPAVQTAFDHFWKNTPAPDGIGIQDHYVSAWKHIADRYADNQTVIGYDIMNEPFNGSEANKIMPKLLEAYATVLTEATGQQPPGAEELMAIWTNEETRLEALQQISEAEKYSKVIDAIYDVNAPFEMDVLSDFYQKARNAIREVDPNHILFLEHGYFNNTGIYSAIQPVMDESGNPDPLQAYAAHGYDLLTDTKEVENPSYERVDFIYNRISETSKRLNMPVMLGEWGAYHSKSQKMSETARHAIGLIEKLNFSNTYWAYYKDIGQYPYFNQAIIRPYPVEISGNLIAYSHNPDEGEFVCEWKENPDILSPTRLFIPNLNVFREDQIWLEPEPDKIILQSIQGSNAGYLLISPTGKPITRNLKIQFTGMNARNIPLK
jgi:endoglycosylceramidase